jgi:Rrf2 family protein
MRVSAKIDYAVRGGAELAAAGEGPVKGERIAHAREIPLKFLENILLDIKHAGLVQSQRGVEGGYWLARSPDEISFADVIRAVEGPIANVRGLRPSRSSTPARPNRYEKPGSPSARTSGPSWRRSHSRISRPGGYPTRSRR